ncbi:sensor histidine kinase [Mucilaginibacter rubeus]|uniref:Histidine kinase n=1 Tax=Mucilaginibacter rubeus TaxID=2027860 RepID=A0A5C1HYZ3_9SPHI|nr:histidine kinase [Mucilaginibacter rubeus]QEM10689.1 histidine kinase [Mucilaginibacter rubeus]
MSFPDNLLNFHKRHRWPSHILYWLVYLLVSVSSSKYYNGGQASSLFEFISDGLYISTEMMAAYGIAYLVIPQFIKKRYLIAAFGFVVISYAACALARIFIVKICEPLAGIRPKASETYHEIFTDIPKLLFVYFFQIMAAAFVFVFFKLLKDKLEIQKKTLLLEKEKAETELKLLKNQLNPHFLFNTLNNIYSLSLISSPATSPSIAGLADILDHILYRCDGQFVSLKAEVRLISNYIELEKLRYDERLTVNFKSDIRQEVEIAPLILLSLVENAFKHGASNDMDKPQIDITLSANENVFDFRVSNTIGFESAIRNNSYPGKIGLSNLRKQLDLIYGKDYSLDIIQDEKLFTVRLTIHHINAVKNEKDPLPVG